MGHDHICLCCEEIGEGEANEHNEMQWYAKALVWVTDIGSLHDYDQIGDDEK